LTVEGIENHLVLWRAVMYFDVNVNQTLNSVVTVWTYQYITGGPRIRDRMGKLFVARLQIYEFVVLS
jgi:hypothetical protein